MTGEKSRLGMMLFILSESVFFLLLVVAYVTYHREHGNGPTAANSLDVIKTGVFSILLFASSATMMLAVRGFRRGRSASRNLVAPLAGRWQLMAALGGTLLLGVAFLVGQGVEYASLLRADVTISRNLFGTTFFTLTGFHGLHVLIGLLMIAVLMGMTLRGTGRQPRPGAVEAVSVYWHFVDGVWVVIFAVVYLWAFV